MPTPGSAQSFLDRAKEKSRRDGRHAGSAISLGPMGRSRPARLIPSQAKEEIRHGSRESKQDHRCVGEELSGCHRRGLAARHQDPARVTGFEVVSLKGKVENGKITEYRVTLEITFILD
jgi:hypothetical protein